MLGTETTGSVSTAREPLWYLTGLVKSENAGMDLNSIDLTVSHPPPPRKKSCIKPCRFSCFPMPVYWLSKVVVDLDLAVSQCWCCWKSLISNVVMVLDLAVSRAMSLYSNEGSTWMVY